ncbi:hypothetical protein [uncultured Chloroflexus sp.]|uniref:hypothetical protein n=1 Tax=uncultured Chloroflexus sp. TaxID=214040 RepID=UPI002632F550|nr:hypothetical protein [uncultured Chloroflexus sp.]
MTPAQVIAEPPVSLVAQVRRNWQAALFLVALILLGCGAAYQTPLSVHLAVGGDPLTRRREDDAPFLQMVHASEPALPSVAAWWELPGAADPYRWTQPASVISLPGLGGGYWLVKVRAQGGRPDGAPTATEWQAGTAPPVAFELPVGQIRRYMMLLPADGTVRLVMRSDSFQAAGDPRVLGFLLREVRVQTIGGWRAPDWGQLGWIGLTLAAAWVWGQMSALSPRWGLSVIGIGGLATIMAIALARPAFALLTPILAALSAGATAVSVSLALRWPQQVAWRPAIGLALLALIVRLAGLLHPHAISSDAGFHANNLLRFGLGHVFLTAGLPAEAGGGLAPYPAGFYLIALPFQILFGDDFATRRLLVTIVAAALDSLFCVAIWWWVRQAEFGQRAALLSAACYLFATQALEALAIGELANVGGQALIVPALLGLSLGTAANRSHWLALSGLALAIAAGLMAHSGVTLGFGFLIGWAWLLAWRQSAAIVTPARLFIAAAGGVALALIIMYTTPVYLELISGRRGQGAIGGQTPVQITTETLLALTGLQPPQRRGLPVPLGLALANLIGLWIIWRTQQPTTTALRWLLGAWWGGALSGLVLLLFADQGLRWMLFLYPALCIPAGIALDRLAARAAWGRVAVAVWLMAIIGQGALLWVSQIRDYLH